VKKSKKKIFYFLLLLMIFKPVWVFNNSDLGSPGNDDLSYWIHAATLIYDFDLNYLNDFEVSEGTFNSVTNTPYHPPGAGYLSSVFVFIFSLFDNANFDRLNPIGSFAFLGYYFATLFYFTFGIFLLSKIIKSTKETSHFDLVLFSAFCGTLAHYVVTRFMMSHAVEFFLCSAIIYLLEKYNRNLTLNKIFIIFLLYFLLSITRPSTFIYSLCLLVIYAPDNMKNKTNYLWVFLNTIFFSTFHIILSKYLYQTNSIFNNYQSNFREQNYTEFDLFSILQSTKYIPNLFFSSSMGLIWTAPIVVFGILSLFINKHFFDSKHRFAKIFTFFYFFGAIVVMMVWQGRDVAYGQRLIIGLIPFCVLQVNTILKNNFLKKLFSFFTAITYLGYFYFYSSKNLTLKPGLTLWGREVGYTGEKYFYNLIFEFYKLENIFTALSENIISINLLYFLPASFFEKLYYALFSTPTLFENLLIQISNYKNIDFMYFFTGTFIYILFSVLFTSILNKKIK